MTMMVMSQYLSLPRFGQWLRKPWDGSLFLILIACVSLQAQDAGQGGASGNDPTWTFHLQSTVVGQGVLPFPAEYSGANSLEPHGEVKDTFSLDVTARVHLWRGGE